MAGNPLRDLPLNTKSVYVRGIHTGADGHVCEIYMPVDSDDDYVIHKKQEQLQALLDSWPVSAPSCPSVA